MKQYSEFFDVEEESIRFETEKATNEFRWVANGGLVPTLQQKFVRWKKENFGDHPIKIEEGRVIPLVEG